MNIKKFHDQMNKSFKKLGYKAKLCDIIGTDENGVEISKHETTFRLEGVNNESVKKCIDRETQGARLKIDKDANDLKKRIENF